MTDQLSELAILNCLWGGQDVAFYSVGHSKVTEMKKRKNGREAMVPQKIRKTRIMVH